MILSTLIGSDHRMRKFNKQILFMEKIEKEKRFLNNCIPQSSLDAYTKFQTNSMKSDYSPHAFLAPTMRS